MEIESEINHLSGKSKGAQALYSGPSRWRDRRSALAGLIIAPVCFPLRALSVLGVMYKYVFAFRFPAFRFFSFFILHSAFPPKNPNEIAKIKEIKANEAIFFYAPKSALPKRKFTPANAMNNSVREQLRQIRGCVNRKSHIVNMEKPPFLFTKKHLTFAHR